MTGSDSDLLIYNRLLREATGLSSVDNENKETSPNSTTLAASDIKANATNEDELVEASELKDDIEEETSIEENVEEEPSIDEEEVEDEVDIIENKALTENEDIVEEQEEEITLDEFKKLISANKKMVILHMLK